jgi:hypothetical protein
MEFSGYVFDQEVVFLEGGEPASDSPVDFLRVLPEREVCMVGKDSDWGFGGRDMWSPML